MKIYEKSINDLIPYEFNNKIHNEDQINKIANSIKEFGFVQPIVIDNNNIVIIGHGRLEAAKKLGLETVPTLVAGELNENQIKKLRILDNKLNESEWNIEHLRIELEELGDLNFGDLDLEISDMFPQFDAPIYNPDDYEDSEFDGSADSIKLIVRVKDEAEKEILKKDLIELGYTDFS